MRAKGFAAMAAIGAILAGCGPLGTAGKADDERSANRSAAVAPAPAAQAKTNPAVGDGTGLANVDSGAVRASAAVNGEAVIIDRAYLLGRWTDNGNCDNAVDFSPDGRFRGFDGTIGMWTVAADRLTVTTAQRTVTMQIVPVDQNRLTVVNADGSLGQSTRC
jgi:hypothetical protein